MIDVIHDLDLWHSWVYHGMVPHEFSPGHGGVNIVNIPAILT